MVARGKEIYSYFRNGTAALLLSALCVAAILPLIQLVILPNSSRGILEWNSSDLHTRVWTQAVTVVSGIMLLGLWLTVYHVLFRQDIHSVRAGTIIVVCAHMLLVYSFVYTIVSMHTIAEEHFRGLKDLGTAYRFFDMIYFTATTMSTVGYGDISPLSLTARFVTITQYIVSFSVVSIILSRISS